MINKGVLMFVLIIVTYILLDFLINRDLPPVLKIILIIIGIVFWIFSLIYMIKLKQPIYKKPEFLDGMTIVLFFLFLIMLGFGIIALFQNEDKRIGWFLIVLAIISMIMSLSHILKNKERIFNK